MKVDLGRELSFEEWQQLTYREKRSIMDRGWDPAKPWVGEETRASILEAFGEANPQLLEKAIAGTGYFTHAGWSITVVVEDSSVRVPRSFDVFRVVKGRLDRSRREVKWLDR